MTDKLTEYQKEFLLEQFFKHNNNCVGWKGIATKLLELGSCIVAGEEPIWIGGIGNFIETETSDHAIGCLLHEFNITSFLNSEGYKERKSLYTSALEDRLAHLKEKLEEVSKL